MRVKASPLALGLSRFGEKYGRLGVSSKRLLSTEAALSAKKGFGGFTVMATAAATLGAAYAAGKLAMENEDWKQSLPGQTGEYLVAGAKAVEECCAGQGLVSPLLERTGLSGSKKNEPKAVKVADIPEDCKPQHAVITPLKPNALFLTIHFEKSANFAKCAAAVADAVEEFNSTNISDSSVAVGFSERVWSTVQGDVPAGAPLHKFGYLSRKGEHGELPATGGDVFFHMKCDDRGECFSMAQKILESLPVEAIFDAEDIYGFQYKNDHDLFGYKLRGTLHDTLKERIDTAVIPTTGGSYALVQQWRHKLYDFKSLSEDEQDSVIGKTKSGKYLCSASINLEKEPHKLAHAIEEGLPPNSHVARMIGVDQNGKRLAVIRQSMPFGNLAPGPVGKDNIHEPGKLFLAYCNNPLVFSYMCERMVGSPQNSPKPHSATTDSLMRYTQCLRGQVYYIPSSQQLAALSKLH